MFHTLITSAWATVTELAPSLFIGLTAAGILHVLVRRDIVLKHVGKPGFLSTFKAAALGVPMPLCSCGVLPAAMALRRDGASPGATVSFLASTPQTGVDSIAATWGMLGWPVALAKMVAALAAGLLSGTLVDRFPGAVPAPPAAPRSMESLEGKPVARAWDYVFNTILGDIWGYLLLGIAASALIFTLVPPGSLAGYGVTGGFTGLLAALLVGLPLYVCSVSSVPVAAAMVYAGFSPGAALVFLMAGPATNAATMAAVRKTLGNRAFLGYMSAIIVVSLSAGLLLNNVRIPVPEVSMHHGSAGSEPVWRIAAGAALLLGMGVHAVRALKGRLKAVTAGSREESVILDVAGMTCGNCVRHVKNALEKLSGVKSVEVTLDPGTAVILPGPGFSSCAALAAVRESGYRAELRGGGCACGRD
jgi:uncharacterized membrane protein YraQ (UPF0718 family)/copper chaperone CopZ